MVMAPKGSQPRFVRDLGTMVQHLAGDVQDRRSGSATSRTYGCAPGT
jgi:hypothetical protein